ncbi:MAG TPA: gamma-glutamylcyclotransferase [Acidiphilium sp.]|nr:MULTISPECIES: gamma-glutamylcyclotransferase [unclassified Acidiphilium]OYV56514.1 MAG: hypothetical protein B7Z76_06320 [Acidiphilium sp. 20-67-58]OYV85375.1 MAG: hypothetical protein B7Z64_05740 [Acidiphilium sp. 21-68-69]HQT59796.1 gamma-glutamylcyclotransferase [Acidiphilium sp.]HQU10854.1 gamma-glutamylcyclotransferase [Acidiphilium sp.]
MRESNQTIIGAPITEAAWHSANRNDTTAPEAAGDEARARDTADRNDAWSSQSSTIDAVRRTRTGASNPLYFAYGSNLDAADWERWCRAREVDPACIKPVAPAFLPDFQLAFDVSSPSRGCGVLDVIPRMGHCVDGCLFEISEHGLAALDRKEGAPNFYHRQDCTAILADGSAVAAFTYVVCSPLREDFVPPDEAYASVCRRGRQMLGLDTSALERAAQGHHPQTLVRGVFVYGTLLSGERRAAALTGAVRPASATGMLVDLGSFPALIPTGEGRVEGEYVVPEDLPETLKELDMIEGADPNCGTDGFYRRTVLWVEVDGGRRPAWAYVQSDRQAGHLPRIRSGSWRNRY